MSEIKRVQTVGQRVRISPLLSSVRLCAFWVDWVKLRACPLCVHRHNLAIRSNLGVDLLWCHTVHRVFRHTQRPRYAPYSDAVAPTVNENVNSYVGVHLSKVRSLTLDKWEPELLSVRTTLRPDTSHDAYCLRGDALAG